MSEWLEVEICREGKIYNQRYERGDVCYPLKEIGTCPEDKTGTKVTFKPDAQIFETTVFEFDILKQRLREMAFLTKNLRIELFDLREDEPVHKVFHYEGGIQEFVTYLNRSKQALYENVMYFEGNKENVYVEVAMQHNDSYQESVYSFVNNINTPEGGTQLTGFRNALTKTFNDYAREKKILKDNEPNLSGEDVREGLTAIVSVKIENPQFEGQTKQKLGNSEAKRAVESIVSEQLTYFLEQNPVVAKLICEKSVLAQRARDAARKAREEARKGKTKNSKEKNLSDKLAPATKKDPKKNELFIVEGDSAGGSAKTGRERSYQAILPLRGKVLNTERCTMEEAYKNAEINTLIYTIGAGVGPDFHIEDCNYDKIIIMTDADDDGCHIQVLLVTFFYRYMRPLIEAGKVYIANPPLYKVEFGKKDEIYVYSDEELKEVTKDKKITDLQRYKGLGEMDANQLWETTMDPERRSLFRVKITDVALAEKRVSILMGDKVEPRKEWIEENVDFTLEDNYEMLK